MTMRIVIARFRGFAIGLAIVAVVAAAVALAGPALLFLAGLIVAGVTGILAAVFGLVASLLRQLDYGDLVGDPRRGVSPAGLSAEARIVALSPPKARIQRRYHVRALDLDLGPPGAPGRRVTTHVAITAAAAGRLAVDARIPLRVDPKNPKRVAVDTAAMPELAGAVL